MKKITYTYMAGMLPEVIASALLDTLLESLMNYVADNPDIENDIVDIIRDSFENFDINYTIDEV